MSYRDFTLERVINEWGITLHCEELFPVVPCHEPSAWLRDTLHRGEGMAWASDKSRTEFMVVPILLECASVIGGAAYLHSGRRLDVDGSRGLSGECDFIWCRSAPMPIVDSPVMIIDQARREDISIGLGNCAAQVVAARLFNEKRRQVIEPLHGCSTTGGLWRFFRLAKDWMTLDQTLYITELHKVLGILTTILQMAGSSGTALPPDPSGSMA